MTNDAVSGEQLAEKRRRFPRLDIDGVFALHDVTLGIALAVRDVSYGGFQVLSPVAMAPGEIHAFRAVVPPGELYELHARVIHCQGGAGPGRPYVIGWQCASDLTTARGITAVLDALTRADSFE